MCVKNMNVATEFYESDLSEYAGLAKFGKVIESVNAELRDDGRRYIDQLTIATFICAMSSSEDPDLTKKYNIRWTFGKVHSEEGKESFQYFVVAEAAFNPQKNRKEKKPQAICRHFSNQLFKFTLRDYEIDEECDYYLKVFLREENEKTWILQSMNFIRVNFN